MKIYFTVFFVSLIVVTLFPPFKWTTTPIKNYSRYPPHEYSIELPQFKSYDFLFSNIEKDIYNYEYTTSPIKYYRTIIFPELLIEYLLLIFIYSVVYLIIKDKLKNKFDL